MKNLLLISILLFGSLAAQASHTVCSSPDLYYSNVRKDFGMAPPKGMEIGSIVIVHEGKVLRNTKRLAGLGGFHIQKYQVRLEGKSKNLHKSGDMGVGSAVFHRTAHLVEVDKLNPSKFKTLAKALVICESAWNHMMP